MEAPQQAPAAREAAARTASPVGEDESSFLGAPGERGKLFEVVADEAVTQLGIVPSALPPKPLILRHIEPGSWAARTGINVGDELVEINDVRVATMDLKVLDNFLRRERPLRLKFVCKKVTEVEPLTAGEFKELKRASTGEIEEFVVKNDDKSLKDPSMDALVGTWVYEQTYEYSISRDDDGQFHFEESRVSGESGEVQRVMGNLTFRQGWLMGEIFDSNQRQRGWIRLHYVEESGTVVSNVRLPEEEGWSDERVAHRKIHKFDCAVQTVDEPADSQVYAAQPQLVDGRLIWPQQWGITRAQCRALLLRLRDDSAWDSRNTMYTLVSDFVVPWTRGKGMGYALLQNQDDPKEVNLMVSHSWGENAEEFLTTLGRSTSSQDVLWICALSMYHAEDGAGPSVREQLGCTPEESPFRRVLDHIRMRGQDVGFRWRWRSCIHLFPLFFALLALGFFYAPIVTWGCVPSIDGTQCLLRRIAQVDGEPVAAWVWSAEYKDWFQANGRKSGFDNEVLPRAHYPATAFCLLVAIVIWVWLWRSRMYHGRLLAVPSADADLYSRLWCAHEVSTASSLGVPVVVADTLAWVGRWESSSASCSHEADRQRIWRIVEQGDEDGKRKLDRWLKRLLRLQQCKLMMMLLGWATPVIVIRSADQRLLSVSAGSLVGADGMTYFFTGALGVLAGVMFSYLVMYATARLEKGTPTCKAVCGCAVFLLVGAVSVTAALLYFGDLRREPPENWIHILDFFFDECFGHLRLSAPAATGCSRLSRFWAAFTQSLLLGGIVLTVFMMGAFCCLPVVKGCIQAAMLALVVAAALLTTSVYAETHKLEEDQIFSVAVFYLTALISRSLAPILAIWAGVSKWGIALHSRRRR